MMIQIGKCIPANKQERWSERIIDWPTMKTRGIRG